MNRRIHELALAASLGEPAPPVVVIAGGVGRGKSFTARVIARWAAAKNARQAVGKCPSCDGSRLVEGPDGWRYCECSKRRGFKVEHIRAYKVGDAAHSLLTIFTLAEGFDDRAEAARKRVADMLAADLLIIDDLGSERNPPPTFEPALSSLVEQRTEKRRPTWIITNITGDEIANRYKERAHSRITGPAETILLTGRDRRRRAA